MVSNAQADFRRKLDETTKKLTDSYASLLRLASLENKSDHASDSLQILAASANIVHACQALLEKVHELKLQVILQDFEGIDQEIDEERRSLLERQAQLQDEVSLLLQERPPSAPDLEHIP